MLNVRYIREYQIYTLIALLEIVYSLIAALFTQYAGITFKSVMQIILILDKGLLMKAYLFT